MGKYRDKVIEMSIEEIENGNPDFISVIQKQIGLFNDAVQSENHGEAALIASILSSGFKRLKVRYGLLATKIEEEEKTQKMIDGLKLLEPEQIVQ